MQGSNYVCPSCFHLLRRRCFAPLGVPSPQLLALSSASVNVMLFNPSVPNGIITACNVRQRSTALWKQHAPQLDVRLVVLPMSQHWIVVSMVLVRLCILDLTQRLPDLGSMVLVRLCILDLTQSLPDLGSMVLVRLCILDLTQRLPDLGSMVLVRLCILDLTQRLPDLGSMVLVRLCILDLTQRLPDMGSMVLVRLCILDLTQSLPDLDLINKFSLQMAHELSLGTLYSLQSAVRQAIIKESSTEHQAAHVENENSDDSVLDQSIRKDHDMSDGYEDDGNIDDCDDKSDEDEEEERDPNFLVPTYINQPDPDDLCALKWGMQRSLHEISFINEKKTVYVRQYNPVVYVNFTAKPLRKQQCPFERDFITKVVKEMEVNTASPVGQAPPSSSIPIPLPCPSNGMLPSNPTMSSPPTPCTIESPALSPSQRCGHLLRRPQSSSIPTTPAAFSSTRSTLSLIQQYQNLQRWSVAHCELQNSSVMLSLYVGASVVQSPPVGSNLCDGQGYVVLFEQASNTFYVTVDTVHVAAITAAIVPLLTMKVYIEGFPSTSSRYGIATPYSMSPDGFDAVSVQNVGSTYMIVSWDLPTDSNGILINFSLYCNGALAGVLPLTVISYNTTGLLPFTLYMYMSSSHARRHCTPVGTWCWASSVLQPACLVHCDSNLLSMRRTALLGDPLILSRTLMTLSSAYLLIRSLTLTSPLAPPWTPCAYLYLY
ncbi:hypothetical protein EMCRGX_G007423 [Ephydatia muelleri]